jgi:hypothetical protein
MLGCCSHRALFLLNAVDGNATRGRQWSSVSSPDEDFGVTSIPELILLNGEGAVVCRDGQEQLRADPTGRNFPWSTTSSRTPRVGFDLTAHTRPDVARLARPVRPPTTELPPKFQRRDPPKANIGPKQPEKRLPAGGGAKGCQLPVKRQGNEWARRLLNLWGKGRAHK